MTTLLEAAKAVTESWTKDNYIVRYDFGGKVEALRKAVQDAEVYTPMTDDEILLKFDACDLRSRLTPYPHKTLMDLRYVERAVIERLGMRWKE